MRKPIGQLVVLALVATALVAAAGCSSTSSTASTASTAMSLSDTLGKSLGLTTDQSAGAIGSYLSYAQEKLPAADYTKVAAAVPGADGYVQKAKDLGAVSGPINNVSGLDAAFGKLGISPEVASKVTPAITNYIGKAGGSTVQGLLGGILK
jgi:hypothetical protein